jgi:transcriptional regulator with XRE-family HTH domain
VATLASIGERLKKERERLGLTQTAFAALADSSKRAQIRYESGERSPDAEYLARLARHRVTNV